MEGSGISLQNLIERYKLSDELLDETLCEEHMREASRVIDNHEILGPELGLSAAQMDAINQKQAPVLLQRVAMLQKWKQKFAWKATYRTLVEALLKCSRADLAQQVCEWLVPRKFKDIPVNVDMQVTTLSLVIAGASSSPDPPRKSSHGMFTYSCCDYQ